MNISFPNLSFDLTFPHHKWVCCSIQPAIDQMVQFLFVSQGFQLKICLEIMVRALFQIVSLDLSKVMFFTAVL